jgi:UDP-glucose 4-epimerase
MLKYLVSSDPEWRVCCLRYFNPVGAHTSGLIGDGVAGQPNNLMPHILSVSTGEAEHLKIFGNDYDTRDGTGERDYIHVMDLAEGHLAALKFICSQKGWFVFNLGTGQTTTVLEFIREFETATCTNIAYKIYGRRPGDIAKSYADSTLAKEILGWQARFSLKDMCLSSYKFKLNLASFEDK